MTENTGATKKSPSAEKKVNYKYEHELDTRGFVVVGNKFQEEKLQKQ